tara:strand:+ start:1487 stop:3469 length:1983 start_codon:yes stop_codon:yes gene_type:complete
MPRVANTSHITNPKRYGYDVQLDDIFLRTAVSTERPLTIQSSDVNQQQSINVKQNPEDFTSNLGRIYSRNNFKAGQGLDTAHRLDAQPDDVHRFWDSKNIDVFHGDDETSYNIHLLYTTEDKNVKGSSTTFSGSNNYMTQTTNGHLWVTDATALYKSTNNGDTWAAETTGATHNFTGITSVGNRVFATTANGTSASQLLEWNGSSWNARTTAQTSAAGLTGIWFAKGMLIISADDGELERVWAITPFNQTWAAGDIANADSLFSFEDTHHVSQVVDAGAVILVACTNGDIYSVKDNAGTYILKGQTNIPFEQVHSIAAAEGQVFFGTKEFSRDVGRFYRAELVVADDLYVLANRQLIKEWVIAGRDTTPKFMFTSRDSVYCGINESGTETNLWRYYLPTGGIARDLSMSGAGPVTSITNTNDKFIMTVAGVDIFKESSTYASTGYLVMSAADFFTAESKQFVGAELSTFTLDTDTSVELKYSTKFESLDNPDDSSYTDAVIQVGGSGDVEKQIAEVSRYIVGKVILNSATGTNTPKVKSVQFRALARPELVVVEVPINISDRVERPGRKPLRVKGLGDAIYKTLRDKEGDSVTLELFEPSEIIRGVVERITYPIQSNDVVGSDTLYAIITVRGTRQPVLTDVTSIHGVGISALGIMRFGG